MATAAISALNEDVFAIVIVVVAMVVIADTVIYCYRLQEHGVRHLKAIITCKPATPWLAARFT